MGFSDVARSKEAQALRMGLEWYKVLLLPSKLVMEVGEEGNAEKPSRPHFSFGAEVPSP